MINILFNIGIDRSGEFKNLPLYVIATREGRLQKMKIINFNKIEYKKYSKEIEDRELKAYAILTFLALKPPLIKNGDQIHMCKDYSGSGRESRFLWYMHKLFYEFFPGTYPFGEPDIEFHSKKCSDLVKRAHKKCDWTRGGRYKLEKCPNLYKYFECLE